MESFQGVPEAGEGFPDALIPFDDHPRYNESQDAKAHRDPVVAVGRDRGAAGGSSRDGDSIGGLFGDDPGLSEFACQSGQAIALLETEMGDVPDNAPSGPQGRERRQRRHHVGH
jgi:hypothetical protein